MTAKPRVFEEHLMEHVIASAHMKGECRLSDRKINIVFGDDYSVLLQKWVDMYRIINRKHNIYFKYITDKETGDTFYYCDEPLTKHQGRGSAKYAVNLPLAKPPV